MATDLSSGIGRSEDNRVDFKGCGSTEEGIALINSTLFRLTVIRPVLIASGTYSEDAEEMLLAIVAHESDMGRYSVQQGISPDKAAQGFFMVEKPTEDDIWSTYLNRKHSFAKFAHELLKLCPNSKEALRENPFYACFMARMKLWRQPKPLPDKNNIELMAHYWFDYYNGSPELERDKKVAEFISDYNLFIKSE